MEKKKTLENLKAQRAEKKEELEKLENTIRELERSISIDDLNLTEGHFYELTDNCSKVYFEFTKSCKIDSEKGDLFIPSCLVVFSTMMKFSISYEHNVKVNLPNHPNLTGLKIQEITKEAFYEEIEEAKNHFGKLKE